MANLRDFLANELKQGMAPAVLTSSHVRAMVEAEDEEHDNIICRQCPKNLTPDCPGLTPCMVALERAMHYGGTCPDRR